eukprot:CAMPEP_0174761984 /NCGR_PEP_ID=MMETSP1094-20130205/109548_1 /TAXON_ID=156173 /ORGANISM="Chrysochromulina brevifilum, Strain UTEX LB 985" /LENGTH=152 /DNA_ID=CAMNT_0015967933 /DNA_START=706 /DNA_END=1164 /DNA_ORIENTATION=+
MALGTATVLALLCKPRRLRSTKEVRQRGGARGGGGGLTSVGRDAVHRLLLLGHRALPRVRSRAFPCVGSRVRAYLAVRPLRVRQRVHVRVDMEMRPFRCALEDIIVPHTSAAASSATANVTTSNATASSATTPDCAGRADGVHLLNISISMR